MSAREVVSAMFATARRGRIDEAIQFLAEDAVVTFADGTRGGRELYADYMRRFEALADPSVMLEVVDFLASGERVVVIAEQHHTRGDRQIVLRRAAEFEVRDDAITRVVHYESDPAGLAEAMRPPAPGA